MPTELRVIGGMLLRFFVIGGGLAAGALVASAFIGVWSAPLYLAPLAAWVHATRWVFGVERRRLWWSWQTLAEGTDLEVVEGSGAPGYDRTLRGSCGGHPVRVRLVQVGRNTVELRVRVAVGSRVPRNLPPEVELEGDAVSQGLSCGLWPFTASAAKARSAALGRVLSELVALVDTFALVEVRAPEGALGFAEEGGGALSTVEPSTDEGG